MKKIKITQKNVSKKIEQFTLDNLVHNRAHIPNDGWRDISIEQSFFDESIDSIVDLIGGNQGTKNTIRFNLRNRPINSWFTNRFVYYNDRWIYIGGQDYTAEMKEIRKILKRS